MRKNEDARVTEFAGEISECLKSDSAERDNIWDVPFDRKFSSISTLIRDLSVYYFGRRRRAEPREGDRARGLSNNRRNVHVETVERRTLRKREKCGLRKCVLSSATRIDARPSVSPLR